jgi:hypothetical protein
MTYSLFSTEGATFRILPGKLIFWLPLLTFRPYFEHGGKLVMGEGEKRECQNLQGCRPSKSTGMTTHKQLSAAARSIVLYYSRSYSEYDRSKETTRRNERTKVNGTIELVWVLLRSAKQSVVG